MSDAAKDRDPRLPTSSEMGSLPDTQEGRGEGPGTSAAYVPADAICFDCGSEATSCRCDTPSRHWHRHGYYRDDDGNEIVGSRGDWMLLAGESVCGPFPTLAAAKRYVGENDV